MSKDLSKFGFEYFFVPMLVKWANEDPDAEEALTTKVIWHLFFERTGLQTDGFTTDDVIVDRHDISPDVSVILYTFPEADQDGLAKYGLVVIDKHENPSYRYFTMEKPYDPGFGQTAPGWFIVEQDGESRFNHGLHTLPDWKDFVKTVISICYDGQV